MMKELFKVKAISCDMKNIKDYETCRGIIVENNKLLLMYSPVTKIYSTPGGGVEKGESYLQCLLRELSEEVGVKKVKSIEKIGYVNEVRYLKRYEDCFNIYSRYYAVTVSEYGEKNLLDYEIHLKLEPVFIDINEAIENNEVVLQQYSNSVVNFNYVQTQVLIYLRDNYFTDK